MNIARILLISALVGVVWVVAEARASSGRYQKTSGQTRDRCRAPCDRYETDDKLPRREGVLQRLFRLPGRPSDTDRDGLRSRVTERIRQRIKQETRWMAPGGSVWYTDYTTAYQAARREHKELLVYFAPEVDDARRDQFESTTLADATVTEWLARYVSLRLPVRQRHIGGGSERTLISDPAFRLLEGKPGLAVIDLVGDEPERDGLVTFARDLEYAGGCSPFELATILGLPRASLTQRMMIYAVRMHPERPESADGEPNRYLLDHAAQHSQHQADIQLQGHHNWDTRFYQVSNRLGSVYSAQEVVAESWGWERSMLDAAKECVHSWRQSPGHWSAVRAPHRFYGYDMKQGANGKWYGTGIFGNASSSSNVGG